MVKQGALLSELQSIVGKKHAREPGDDLRYTVDGLVPKAVVEPGTYREIAEVLRFANTERLAVIPRGSGTQVHVGNIPDRYDIALSLARLDKIIEHEPADLTVTCQAGVTVGALSARLSASGQMVPFARDPSSIGGLLASNDSSARDFTIGLRVVSADGRVIRAGGKVVKNVAGYDLCKLYIGSRGTLDVIVEATLKTVPIPEFRRSFCFEFSSPAEACSFAHEAQGRGFPFDKLALNRFGGPPTPLPVRKTVIQASLSGTSAAIGRITQDMLVLVATFGGQPGDDHQLLDIEWYDAAVGREGWPLGCVIRVLPTKVPELIHALDEQAVPAQLLAYPTDGIVAPFWPSQGADEGLLAMMQRTVVRFGGTYRVSSCAPELKRQIDVFGPPPPSFPLMRAIKQQFDPNNVLSPGRFVGRL